MTPTCFRPERPGYASPGQSAATPWVSRPPMGLSPERASHPSAPPAPATLCRPFRAGVLSAGSPRALPWAVRFRPVGALASAPVLAGHSGFTAEPAGAWHADRELDFILNYDIKYRLGRSPEEEE